MNVSGKKHIFWMSMLVASFVVFGDGLKAQGVKADTVKDDILVDDLDKDILTASKIAPADTSKKDSVKDSSAVKVKESEEELILDGGAEDLLGASKVVKPIDSLPKAVQKTDSSKVTATSSETIENKALEKEKSSVSTESKKVVAQVPAKIEAANSINFARNLKDYRSPKIAMLLSLLLPGAGEIYAKNGVRAAVFGAVEVGVIAAGVAYAVKGKNQIDDANSYADKHYSVDNFSKYYKKLKNFFPQTTLDSIIFTYDDNPANFSKSTSGFKDLIAEQTSPYIQGWDDVEPQFDSNFNMRSQDSLYRQLKSVPTPTDSTPVDSSFLVCKVSDTTAYAFGFSKNQGIYSNKVSKGNKTYKISKNIFTLLVINHIVSAIDAGICAKAYNDKLLGKQSLWQKINIRDLAINTPSGTASGYALEVRF